MWGRAAVPPEVEVIGEDEIGQVLAVAFELFLIILDQALGAAVSRSVFAARRDVVWWGDAGVYVYVSHVSVVDAGASAGVYETEAGGVAQRSGDGAAVSGSGSVRAGRVGGCGQADGVGGRGAGVRASGSVGLAVV